MMTVKASVFIQGEKYAFILDKALISTPELHSVAAAAVLISWKLALVSTSLAEPSPLQ